MVAWTRLIQCARTGAGTARPGLERNDSHTQWGQAYVFSPSRRWSSRFSVSSQIARRRNKLKLELQRRSGHSLNRYGQVAPPL
jgi:hypothetical protein